MTDHKIITFEAQLDHHNKRIDKILGDVEDIGSRSRASKLIDAELVFVDGKKAKASTKLEVGQVVEVHLPTVSDNSELIPLDMPLEIAFEDEDIVVIVKPAGLVVHPAAGHEQDTLVNALIHHSKDLSMGFGEKRPGIVHRLDKDTSGLLVVAKNDRAQHSLAQQFKEKTVDRRYWAITFGRPKEDTGTIISHLNRHPVDRKRFASEKIVDDREPKGKRAVTHFKVLDHHQCSLAWVECQLETGRTHQIRVHLSEAGYPIVADELYGSAGRLKNLKSVSLRKQFSNLNRIALHAFELGFNHPRSGERLLFQSPWPEDILPICKSLGFNKKL